MGDRTIPVLPEDIRAALVGNLNYAVLSAYRDEYTTAENIQRTKDLVHALQCAGYSCVVGEGFWGGKGEECVFVPDIERRDLFDFANACDQDAVIYAGNLFSHSGATYKLTAEGKRVQFFESAANAPHGNYTNVRGVIFALYF